MKKREQTISDEQAVEEFEAWLEAMDLYPEPARMDPDSAQGYRDLRESILRALRFGHLTTNADGNLELHLKSRVGTSLVFREPLGLTIRQIDKVKGDMTKIHEYIAAMTKSDLALIDQLGDRDLRPARALCSIFLALK